MMRRPDTLTCRHPRIINYNWLRPTSHEVPELRRIDSHKHSKVIGNQIQRTQYSLCMAICMLKLNHP